MKTLLRKLLMIAERVFVCLVLHLMANGYLTLTVRGSSSSVKSYTGGDAGSQTLWLGAYIITFCLIILRWKQFIRAAMADKLLLLLVGIALGSIVWSVAPDVTLRRGFGLLGTTLFGMYFATRYNPAEQLRLLAWTLSIGALFSLVVCLALPQYGIMGANWRGVYMHKNSLGSLMAMNTVILLLLSLNNSKYRWITGIGAGLSVCLLLLSRSVTALVVLITLLTLLPLYRALRWNYSIMVPFLIFVLLAGAGLLTWISENTGTVLTSLGKDSTLTGRVGVWEVVMQMIQQRPLLGYGYNAFWLGWESKYSAYVWSVLPWPAPNSHNGLLDLGLDLGCLGIIVFLLGFLMVYIRAVGWLRSIKTSEGLWPLEYLSLVVVTSYATSVILMYNDIYWVLYVAIALSTKIYHSRASKAVY